MLKQEKRIPSSCFFILSHFQPTAKIKKYQKGIFLHLSFLPSFKTLFLNIGYHMTLCSINRINIEHTVNPHIIEVDYVSNTIHHHELELNHLNEM